MKKIALVWEERKSCFRLHVHCLLGPWRMDPAALRLVLWAPDGTDLETWWPQGEYIERRAIGHFVVDIQPLQVGTWRGRWDSYGEVGSVKTFAFETSAKGRVLRWDEIAPSYATLARRPVLTR